MKKFIISYSLTGNNRAVAKALAEKIGANLIQVSEKKKRSKGKILIDTFLKRTPEINLSSFDICDEDFVILNAPIWLGQVAAPMRSIFEIVRKGNFKYAFISLSGGADGPDSNDKISEELEARIGRKPEYVLDLHKADLLPAKPQPTREMTMNYQITKKDLDILMAKATPIITG